MFLFVILFYRDGWLTVRFGLCFRVIWWVLYFGLSCRVLFWVTFDEVWFGWFIKLLIRVFGFTTMCFVWIYCGYFVGLVVGCDGLDLIALFSVIAVVVLWRLVWFCCYVLICLFVLICCWLLYLKVILVCCLCLCGKLWRVLCCLEVVDCFGSGLLFKVVWVDLVILLTVLIWSFKCCIVCGLFCCVWVLLFGFCLIGVGGFICWFAFCSLSGWVVVWLWGE